MVDIVQQVSTDIVLSDKSEAEAGTNNTKFMTPLRTKEAIDKNLVPFNAMSQSQFEAIRAANNEEFAASGFVHFGKHAISGTQLVPINEGLYTNIAATDTNRLLFGRGTSGPSGVSKTSSPIINVAGVIFDVVGMNYANTSQFQSGIIKFPQTPDGKTTYNKSTGAIVTHVDSTTAFAAQQADPTNVEVVIDRVDMWGFEAWLEEVNSTNPFVYPNGLIQSQATAMDGINTSASARPVTYYAVFDGDTTSKGKGVNFFTLTDAQKKKVLGNHKNNLYYLDDGRLVQWRLRQRSFAGAGNGDWINIDTTASANSGQLSFSIKHVIKTHGAQNTAKPNDAASDGYQLLNQTSPNWLDGSGLGIWARHKSVATQSVNGELFFLVCGTVNRLNQGAYHPSFNPSGTRLASGGNAWSSPAGISALTSTVTCFENAYVASGNISSAYSGRPSGENQYFDAIYSSGFGGVCRDMRYSAYGLTPTDFAEADQRVKNGTYRGFEKLIFSRVTATQNSVPNNSTINFASAVPSWVKVGDTVISVSGVRSKIGSMSANSIFTLTNNGVMVNEPIVIESELPYSVGGSFLQTDVIGSPSNILATPQLANGWQGSWIPVIPDGTSKEFRFTRKGLSFDLSYQASTNNGGSWISNPMAALVPSQVTNSYTIAHSAGAVVVLQYQAFAKQTKPSPNAVVYGGQSGIGDVFASSFYDKSSAALCESLISKVPTNGKHVAFKTYKLTSLDFVVDKIHSYAPYYIPAHNTLDLAQPENNSVGYKALNYNVASNQQGFINYAYTELKHNGTNWGDDGKVAIVDNQSTKTDLNGNTVLVGTAQLNEPLGWIKLTV